MLAGAFSVKPTAAVSESQTENSWETLPTMPSAGGYATAVVDSKIYVFSGSVFYEYDVAEDAWIVRTAMPTSRTGFAVAACEGKIYVIGGHPPRGLDDAYDYDPVGLNEAYDLATDTWTTKEPVPTNRWQMKANVVDGKIYVISGRTAGPHSTVNVTEVYDPVTDSWATKASIPYPVVGYASAVINNKIYVIGGQDEFDSRMNIDNNQIYDVENDTWSQGTPIPATVTWGVSAAATTGVSAPKRIYVMGGDGGFFEPSSQHYVYDPQIDTWSSAAALPIPRISPALATVGDVIYVIGGSTSNEYDGWPVATAVVERYTPFLFAAVPAVSVVSPHNETYFSGDVSLTFAVSEPTLSLSYSLDGQDSTIAGNTTLADLSPGVHSITVYAWDTAGNVGRSETIIFTVAPFPTALTIAVLAVAAAFGVGLVVYFKKKGRVP